MTTEQLMETQRYLESSNVVTCCCCGTKSNAGLGVCGRCRVPLIVSESVEKRGIRPHFIPILGGSGAGKTVFIGMLLDMLSKGFHEVVGQPNNAFSVAVQQQTLASLERRRFPDKTICESDAWEWIHCEVSPKGRKSKQPLDLVAPDLAGEGMLMELEHPRSFPVVHTCVSRAFAVMLLIDAARARDHGTDEDLLATKIATYVCSNARCNGDARKTSAIPFAIVFTKTDLCKEAADDPQRFAKHNLPGFYAYSDRNLPKKAFFGSTIVGSVTKTSDEQGVYTIPLHVQPTGVMDPLAWILTS